MAVHETDEEIIALYRNGQIESFKKLIDRYTPLLYNFIARLTDWNNTPDIVQEVFIKAWKNIERFDERKASFKTWVFTIARNSATDYLRKKKSILFSDLEERGDLESDSFGERIPDEEMLPDEAIKKLEDKEFLNRILNKLPIYYREVLILYYQEEMTFGEIAKVLGKPLNTVKSQHRRAIGELRKYIGGGT
jgi:RNA polymerase sigma-70 factor, ECF subfamily